MRWMGWTALLCLALSAFAQESEIEIEEPPDPADAPEEKPPEEKPPEEKPPEARAPQEAFGPAPARGEGHELKWTEVRDRAKTFTLEVPDDWRLREAPPEKGREGTTFDLLLPGREGMCSLRIYDEADRTDPRGAPARIREAFAKDAGYVSSEIRGDPVPHALLRFRDPKGEWENLVAFIRTRGRTMQLRLGGRPDDVAFARADALAAAQRLTTAMPELPEIPEGFKVSRKGSFRYALDPAVETSTRHILRTLHRAQRVCARLHGRLPRPPRGKKRPVVFIRPSRGGDVIGEIGPSARRLDVFAYGPNDEKGDAYVASYLGQMHASLRWSTAIPLWVSIGERRVVQVETVTGLRLPAITSGYARWLEGVMVPELPRMTREQQKADSRTFGAQAFGYVTFFHTGPRKYRDAYRAFLDDVGENLDARAAAKRHLEPLGWAEMCDEANRFLVRELRIESGR